MTVQEALDFIRECRDSHVRFAAGEVPADPRAAADVDYGPGGEVEFHAQCVRDYDRALKALRRGLKKRK